MRASRFALGKCEFCLSTEDQLSQQPTEKISKEHFPKKSICQAALPLDQIMRLLLQRTSHKTSVQGLAVLSPEDLIILLGIPHKRVAQL